jgi:RsiW-degrading membrane proteinase PrsW (M82 family)
VKNLCPNSVTITHFITEGENFYETKLPTEFITADLNHNRQMFLFMFAAEGVKSANPASLLIPLPAVIGFGLLFGYYWTLVKKRHIGWFWIISLIFNGLISKLCLLGVAYALYESGFKSPGESLFALFPLWTLFVAFASGYYFKHRDGATSKIRLP